MLLVGSREVQKGIAEQVRGMKVRSSVKKLCEGCKVRLAIVLGLCCFVFDCAGRYIMEDEQ